MTHLASPAPDTGGLTRGTRMSKLLHPLFISALLTGAHYAGHALYSKPIALSASALVFAFLFACALWVEFSGPERANKYGAMFPVIAALLVVDIGKEAMGGNTPQQPLPGEQTRGVVPPGPSGGPAAPDTAQPRDTAAPRDSGRTPARAPAPTPRREGERPQRWRQDEVYVPPYVPPVAMPEPLPGWLEPEVDRLVSLAEVRARNHHFDDAAAALRDASAQLRGFSGNPHADVLAQRVRGVTTNVAAACRLNVQRGTFAGPCPPG